MSRVVLLPYDAAWPAHFQQARTKLQAAFADASIAIEHIGSTAVPGLCAKPVIDVLAGAPSLARIEQAIPALQATPRSSRRWPNASPRTARPTPTPRRRSSMQ